jgi:hypothetical protein
MPYAYEYKSGLAIKRRRSMMTLNNQNLIALSKFAMKAKRHIGLVMTQEMTHDRQYASSILIKATLSDDHELVDMTRKISVELDVGVEVIAAIESYLNSLVAKGVSNKCIVDSKHFLGKLALSLPDTHADGASYRQTVEALIKELDVEERRFCISLAREFYVFWIRENSLADEFYNVQVFESETQKEELMALWNNIEQEFFSDTESLPLNMYINSMRKIGVSERDVNIRRKIAKVLIVALRNKLGSAEETYRDAINKTQHLFLWQDQKEFFLIVSREFHHFWLGNIQKH